MLREVAIAGLRVSLLVAVLLASVMGMAPVVRGQELSDVNLKLVPDEQAGSVDSITARWVVRDAAGEIVKEDSGTIAPNESFYVGQLERGATYTVDVDAEPGFAPVRGLRFTVGDQSVVVVDIPLEANVASAANVTITVSSADQTVASTLPADATWSVSVDGTPVAGDTFAGEHLALPATISVAEPVPYGEFQVSIAADPVFAPYSATFTVDEPEEAFAIQLMPLAPAPDESDASDGVDVAEVTVEVVSGDPDAAGVLPEGASWRVALGDGTVVDSGVFAAEHLGLPATIPVAKPVPYGEYVVSVDASPAFAPFEQTYLVDQPEQVITLVLVPVVPEPPAGQEPPTQEAPPAGEETEVVDVVLAISAPDGGEAAALPEGTTWALTSVEDSAVTFTGEIAGDARALPAQVAVGTPVPVGEYVVTVDARPAFELFEDTFAIVPDADPLALARRSFAAQAAPAVTLDIVLVPVQQDAPAPAEPGDGDQQTAPPPATPAAGSPGTADAATPAADAAVPATSTPAAVPEHAATAPVVTALPNTGAGGSTRDVARLLVAAAGLAVLTAGGMILRDRRLHP